MKYRVVISKVAADDMEALPTNLFDTITRVLFDLEGEELTVQADRHRRHAYSSEPGRKKRKGQH
jgi:hypothetical protein